MGLNAKTTGGGDFERLPVGNHRAVCCALIDLGDQYEVRKAKEAGKADKEGWEPKVYLCFALLDEQKADGTPHVAGRMYYAGLTDTCALRAVYVSLCGKVPDDETASFLPMLGKACMVECSLDKSGKYVNLSKVAGPMALDVKKPPKSPIPPVVFDIDDGEAFIEPDWMPFIYGKRVNVVVGESRQRGGKPVRGWGGKPAGQEQAAPQARAGEAAVA